MRVHRLLSLVILAVALPAMVPGAARAQVDRVTLVHAGDPVPLRITPDLAAMGRALGHGLLAGAREDVTRPVTDDHIVALGRRGTLLRVRLARPEDVLLLRLGARARPSRLAAYVPPDRDDRAYVFLGRERWERIVVVDLPAKVRRELRSLRERAGRGR